MRRVRGMIVCGAVAMCCLPTAPAADRDVPPELKWARGIADDFWQAALGGQPEQAAGLLSPELARCLVSQEWSGAGPKDRLLDLPPDRWLARHLPAGREVSVKFESQELSPDRAEVVLRGRLSGKDLQGEPVATDFTMRVARAASGRAWCIRFLLVTKRKEPDGKGR